MRIAVVCPYDLGRFGGVQDQAIKLTGWLNAAGHDAVLVGPGMTGPADSVLLGPTIIVPSNGAATPISMRPRVWRKVAEAVAGCDVVHLHEPLMPMVSLQSTRKLGVPIVGTFHADVSRGWRAVLRLMRGIVRRWISRLSVVTAVSPVAGDALRGLADPQIIPNGLDVELYSGGTDARRANRVMFLGRDDPRKGLDVLLAAWPTIREAVPDAELVVAGASRPTAAGVRFLGRVDEAEKRSLLREATLFVAPNLGGESFGIVLAEAMAAGCAVIASDLPAFREVLGDAGVIVPVGDEETLAATIVAHLQDVAACDELRSRAAQRVRSFDRSTVVEAYIDAYESAVRAT